MEGAVRVLFCGGEKSAAEERAFGSEFAYAN